MFDQLQIVAATPIPDPTATANDPIWDHLSQAVQSTARSFPTGLVALAALLAVLVLGGAGWALIRSRR